MLVSIKLKAIPGNLQNQILVVDDDQGHAKSVCELLSAEGHEVDFVTEGAKGLQAVKDRSVGLLILDLDIPDLPGVEILRYVDANNIDTKTIVLSGETDLTKVAPILRLGAYDYLPKPYQATQLLTCVRNAVKQAELEEQVEAQNKLHGFLVDATQDLVYMLDADGNFTYLNDRLRDVFDYDAAALTGKSWRHLMTAPHIDALERLFDERRTGVRATRQFEFDFENFVVEISAMGLYQHAPADNTFIGTYGVVRDVTETRRTARALEQSQAKYRGLFLNSPDAVFMIRLNDGVITERNDNFDIVTARMGIAHAETDAALFESVEGRQTFVDELRVHADRHVVILDRTIDGEMRSFELTSRLLNIDNEPFALSTLRDRTAEKRAERDRLQLGSQLQQASKMEAIGQLAGGIAHDFNNILASMIGYAELVQVAANRLDSVQVQGYLREVIMAGQRARDLISQMLTFARARRGNVTRLNVADVIADVSRMLRAAIPTNIEIGTHFAGQLPPVDVDPVQLQQIVLNLMINARDAIEGNGRIDVRVTSGHVEAQCASCSEPFDEEYVVLAIVDTGHGIDADILPRIFDMYMTTRAPGEGTGMGLWLTHTLVHAYGGHVRVETEAGKGARFEILLPLSSADQPAADPADDIVEVDPPVGPIVVVDDDASVSNFIGEVLKNAGYDVEVFEDSAAALAYVQENLDKLALIVTDQLMPNVSGLDIAEHAKRLRGELPVVLITGRADGAVSASAKRLGVERFMKKPFRIDDLLSAVRELAHSRPKP
ncbi:MAG: response regulator [Gammaproteobacteria bacterium]|nr:response regulator [Gammaproteobacteria bacterium]